MAHIASPPGRNRHQADACDGRWRGEIRATGLQASAMNALSPPAVERRQNHALRAALDSLYPRLEAFFDASRTWGGSSMTTLVYRVVRESCPQLSPLEAQVLVNAAQRLYRTRPRHAAAEAEAVNEAG
jgi:hypothetical protein